MLVMKWILFKIVSNPSSRLIAHYLRQYGSKTLQKQLQTNPKNCTYLFDLAIALNEKNLTQETESVLNYILGLEPPHESAHRMLATLYGNQNKYALAITHIDMALDQNPHSAPNHFVKGMIFYLQQDYPNAILSLRAALGFSPKFPLAQFFLTKAQAILKQLSTPEV